MNENCCICMERCLIPVEIICFPCYRLNQLGCSSFCRICIMCANHFLQLDMHQEQRDFVKKCIYCPATIPLHLLSNDKAFRVDYSLMLLDSKPNHICPFCLNYTGNQIMLHHHLEKECPKFPKQCECKKVFLKQDFYFHLFTCPSHIHCPLCTKYISKLVYNDHLKTIHAYDSCPHCEQFISTEFLINHTENICPLRPVICTFCFKLLKYNQYHSHLNLHLNETINEMRDIKQKYQECYVKYKEIFELLGPFRTLLEG